MIRNCQWNCINILTKFFSDLLNKIFIRIVIIIIETLRERFCKALILFYDVGNVVL